MACSTHTTKRAMPVVERCMIVEPDPIFQAPNRLPPPRTRRAQGMPKRVANAKIACLDMNLQKARMHMGVQVRWGRRFCGVRLLRGMQARLLCRRRACFSGCKRT